MAQCRFCKSPLSATFAKLGMSPLANSYITQSVDCKGETFFPLHVYVCENCFLVQIEEFSSAESIFSRYDYFSSFSAVWLQHAADYASLMMKEYGINKHSFVAELASNDGYLLQNFIKQGIKCLGIEPAANVADIAIKKGVATEIAFWGVDAAEKLLAKNPLKADLIIGNNVLAHVPDINDFVGGMKCFLSESGFITMEFPHLLNLISQNQFDTIYHEHFSYLSFMAVETIFNSHDLRLFKVDELATHGGSLRIFACHKNAKRAEDQSVSAMREKELGAGLREVNTYTAYAKCPQKVKCDLLRFLLEQQEKGKVVVGYGAPAKGNTLLNYCGVKEDLIPFTVDRSPHKQNKLLPGTHIPIRAPEAILQTKPDYVLILPWNLADEIMTQMQAIRSWGGNFVRAIPHLEIL